MEKMADLLLRFVAFAADVDYLMVAMRSPELVTANVASVLRGPLTAEELQVLSTAP